MNHSENLSDRIVWIDCEMTGLDLTTDALVEVAAVVTDSDLHVLGRGVDVIVAPPPGALEAMGDVVREMHTVSGLLEELTGGLTMAEAERQVMDYIRAWVPEARRAPLAGNSVSTDRSFIDRDMPELSAHLHYRTIDVSSLKELARRWFPRVYFNTPPKHGGHRALADILESIDELRYYREVLFVAEPGPDTPTARKASAHVVATSVKASVPGFDSEPPVTDGTADGVAASAGTGHDALGQAPTDGGAAGAE